MKKILGYIYDAELQKMVAQTLKIDPKSCCFFNVNDEKFFILSAQKSDTLISVSNDDFHRLTKRKNKNVFNVENLETMFDLILESKQQVLQEFTSVGKFLQLN